MLISFPLPGAAVLLFQSRQVMSLHLLSEQSEVYCKAYDLPVRNRPQTHPDEEFLQLQLTMQVIAGDRWLSGYFSC